MPYRTAVFFIKQKYKILQIETFQNSNAPYPGNAMKDFNFLNFLPENSRRLKPLPVCFSLVAYGKKGIRYIVKNNIRLARLFGVVIDKSDEFELLAATRLNTVCFTLPGEENQRRVTAFLSKLNDTGKVFITPIVYNNNK